MSNKVSAWKFSQFILYSRGQVLPSAPRYQSVNIGQEKFKVQRSNIDVRSDKIYSLWSLSSSLSYTTTLVELCQARRPTEVRETVSRTERSLVIWSLITSQSGPEEIISCHITVTRPPSTHLELIRIFYTSCLLLDERSQVTSAKVDNYMGVSVRKFYAIKGSCLEGDN